MAATTGSFQILGNSGRIYSVNLSIPDAAGALCTFNPDGLSATTSPSEYRVPESGRIISFCLTTAPTATGCVFYANSQPIQGSNVRYAGIATATVHKHPCGFPVRQGDLLSILEW